MPVDELHLLEPNDFDPAELTPAQSRAALAAWYLTLVTIVCIVAIVLLATIHAGAVELHISGSISGSGNQSLFFAGDNLSAFWNGTALNVTAVST